MSLVPQGRLEVVQDGVAANFQPSLRDWSSSQIKLRTSSWAKFNRPYGTEFGLEFLHGLFRSSGAEGLETGLA